ncbi:MAG: hypothetical protein AAGF07_01105 [Patescibacteria group bacterium]
MARPKFYKVNTLPSRATQANLGIINRLTKGRRRRQLVASIVGVYIIVGGLAGWVLFNNNANSAQASEPALISASLKITEDKEYKLGDNIKIGLTLQNTSVSESLNNININVFSTKDSIRWSSINSGTITSKNLTITPEGLVQLPLLSSGERVEYELLGNIQNNQLEYTNIQAKLKYLNREGAQDAETNRVRLNTKTVPEKTLLNLSTNKDSFAVGEELAFTLEPSENQNTNGKIYISNRQTQELTDTLECDVENGELCEHNLASLPLGDYSALYIDSEENNYSNIQWFSTIGPKDDFVPSSQTSLELPIGNASINGLLTVIANKVISQNQTPSPDNVCNFEIYSGETLINSIKIPVDNERSCKANFSSDVFKNTNGLYKIKLANTSLEKEVSFLNKPAQLIELESESTILEKGKPVQIKAENILNTNVQTVSTLNQTDNNSESETVDEEQNTEENVDTEEENNEDSVKLPANLALRQKVTLGILHTSSGEYREVTNINGESLAVIDGQFSTSIAPSYLSKGGFYLVYIKLEDGQTSDWLALDFEDKQIALSSTGVLYSDNSLQIGQSMNFTLENLLDRSGNQVNEGDCSANIYVVGTPDPINVQGQIKQGNCNANLPAGEVTKAGPALITFSSNEFQNKINQSKQIKLAPGSPTKFGNMVFESPVKTEFANNLIIGPVTDTYGNAVDIYNFTLNLSNTITELEVIPITIQNGFAQIQIPSSYLSDTSVNAVLKNDIGEELLSKDFDIDQTEGDYIQADLPTEIANDDNIKATISGLELENLTECKLSLIKSEDEISETTTLYDLATRTCTFDWELNENRSADQVMLLLTVGEQSYAKITTLTSAEPQNLFIVSPQIRITTNNELAINLLTSPLYDRQGKAISNGSLKWQYNGKVVQTSIENSLSSLELPADRLESKDIQLTSTERNLDLDLDVKAGITSISKTNNLSIYIGNYDISNSDSNFDVHLSSNLITEGQNKIFEFNSDICTGKLVNNKASTMPLKTHVQAGNCYVEAIAQTGENTIKFEKAGFVTGLFTYATTTDQQDVNWCETTSTSDKCLIQVLAPINSQVTAIIRDQENEYKFVSGELENTVIVSQNGLNPLKEYTVEVSYKSVDNRKIVQTKQILGEKLIK